MIVRRREGQRVWVRGTRSKRDAGGYAEENLGENSLIISSKNWNDIFIARRDDGDGYYLRNNLGLRFLLFPLTKIFLTFYCLSARDCFSFMSRSAISPLTRRRSAFLWLRVSQLGRYSAMSTTCGDFVFAGCDMRNATCTGFERVRVVIMMSDLDVEDCARF